MPSAPPWPEEPGQEGEQEAAVGFIHPGRCWVLPRRSSLMSKRGGCSLGGKPWWGLERRLLGNGAPRLLRDLGSHPFAQAQVQVPGGSQELGGAGAGAKCRTLTLVSWLQQMLSQRWKRHWPCCQSGPNTAACWAPALLARKPARGLEHWLDVMTGSMQPAPDAAHRLLPPLQSACVQAGASSHCGLRVTGPAGARGALTAPGTAKQPAAPSGDGRTDRLSCGTASTHCLFGSSRSWGGTKGAAGPRQALFGSSRGQPSQYWAMGRG